MPEILGLVVIYAHVQAGRTRRSGLRCQHQRLRHGIRRGLQEYVHACAIQKRGQNGRRGCRAVVAEDPFVGHAARDLHPGAPRNGPQNLLQAGVVRAHLQHSVGELHLSPARLRAGWRGRQRRGGDRCRHRVISRGRGVKPRCHGRRLGRRLRHLRRRRRWQARLRRTRPRRQPVRLRRKSTRGQRSRTHVILGHALLRHALRQ